MNDSTPYANSLFEQPWWLDVVAPGQWHEVLVTNKNNEIIARMPYVLEQHFYGKMIHMPKLTQTLGPWIVKSTTIRGNHHLDNVKKIIEELFSQLPDTINCNMTMNCVNNYILPFHWLGYKILPTFSYRFDNLQDLNTIWENFSKRLQEDILKDEKASVISNETDFNVLYGVLEATFVKQKRHYPFPKDFIKNIIDRCERLGHGRMFISRDNVGHVQAASFLVYDEQIAYSLIGGGNPSFPTRGAKARIYWEMIKYASTVSKAFDFEGSMIEGIESFYRKFGAKLVTNYNISKGLLPFEIASILKPRIKRMIGYKM